MADESDIQHPELINRGIDVQISDWPDSLKEGDPGPDNPAARAEWFREQKRVADAVKEHTSSEGDDTGDAAAVEKAREQVKERFGTRGL